MFLFQNQQRFWKNISCIAYPKPTVVAIDEEHWKVDAVLDLWKVLLGTAVWDLNDFIQEEDETCAYTHNATDGNLLWVVVNKEELQKEW